MAHERDPYREAVIEGALPDRLDVEAERAGVSEKVVRPELVLVCEQCVVHFPETALAARRLGGRGGAPGVIVDVGQRQVAEGVIGFLDDALQPSAA